MVWDSNKNRSYVTYYICSHGLTYQMPLPVQSHSQHLIQFCYRNWNRRKLHIPPVLLNHKNLLLKLILGDIILSHNNCLKFNECLLSNPTGISLKIKALPMALQNATSMNHLLLRYFVNHQPATYFAMASAIAMSISKE